MQQFWRNVQNAALRILRAKRYVGAVTSQLSGTALAAGGRRGNLRASALPLTKEGDFRTQARLSQHLRDIRLILSAAAAAGQELPLTETHRQLLEKAEAAGFGDADNSAIIRAFERHEQ